MDNVPSEPNYVYISQIRDWQRSRIHSLLPEHSDYQEDIHPPRIERK